MFSHLASQLFIILLTSLSLSNAFSNLRTCTDTHCARSNRTIDMTSQSRHANTTCQPINVAIGGSFQILELDPGCLVTLYAGSTSGMCSSETHVEGYIDTCYSSSWMYYAIEGCRPIGTTSSVAVALSSSAVTSRATSSEDSERRGGDARHDGVIAGTVIATISGVALIFTGILVLLRRRPRGKPLKAQELSNDRALVETVSVEKQMAKEMWADHAVAEIGRNSKYEEALRRSFEKTSTEQSAQMGREQPRSEAREAVRISFLDW